MRLTAKGQRSREKLLRAAVAAFAQHGFRGASLDGIVRTAGVNKRMVYHYFGSKQDLYQAALTLEYEKLSVLEVRSIRPGDPFETTLRRLVGAYFDFLGANPRFVQLLLWENLHRGSGLRGMRLPLSKGPMLALLVRAVNDGKRDGTVRPEVDPRGLLVSLIGNCLVYSSNRYTLSAALGVRLQGRKELTRARKAVMDLLLHGVLA